MRNISYLLLTATIVFIIAACTKQEDVKLNVMSFNIRYDNPEDSLHNWKYRKGVAAQVIKYQQVDVVGAQEVLHNQLLDLNEQLSEFNFIGVGREDGVDQGEYSAIFYNSNRFKEIESGYFWLSQTPDIAGSIGWDGACERIATWCVLEENKSKKHFFVINTHLDHVGKQAREEGVALLIKRTNEIAKDLPIIITGDFNAEPESDIVKHILSDNNPMQLFDSRNIAVVKDENINKEWSFHGFGGVPLEHRKFIDYIFVSEDIVVDKFDVLPEKLNDIYVSDHRPIIAEITLK